MLTQRYLLWLRFNGAHFSGMAKSGSHHAGVIDILNLCLPPILRERGIDGQILVSPASWLAAALELTGGKGCAHVCRSHRRRRSCDSRASYYAYNKKRVKQRITR